MAFFWVDLIFEVTMAESSGEKDRSVRKCPWIVEKEEVTGRRDRTSGLRKASGKKEKKIGMEK